MSTAWQTSLEGGWDRGGLKPFKFSVGMSSSCYGTLPLCDYFCYLDLGPTLTGVCTGPDWSHRFGAVPPI